MNVLVWSSTGRETHIADAKTRITLCNRNAAMWSEDDRSLTITCKVCSKRNNNA